LRINCDKRHEAIGVSIVGVKFEMAEKPFRKRDWVCCDHCDREVSSSTFHRHQRFKISESVLRDQDDEDASSSSSSEDFFFGHHTENDGTLDDTRDEPGKLDSEQAGVDVSMANEVRAVNNQ